MVGETRISFVLSLKKPAMATAFDLRLPCPYLPLDFLFLLRHARGTRLSSAAKEQLMARTCVWNAIQVKVYQRVADPLAAPSQLHPPAARAGGESPKKRTPVESSLRGAVRNSVHLVFACWESVRLMSAFVVPGWPLRGGVAGSRRSRALYPHHGSAGLLRRRAFPRCTAGDVRGSYTVGRRLPSETPPPLPVPTDYVLISETAEWRRLVEHASEIDRLHLRELMQDVDRVRSLRAEYDGIYLDYSRQRVTKDTIELLFALARRARLVDKIRAMQSGAHINVTERRAVLHTALRAERNASLVVDGTDVVRDVWRVLDHVREFSERVRSGEHRGATGKPLRSVIAVGIGGSYLGPDFVHEAFRTDPEAFEAARGRHLHFLSNVDPVDIKRCTQDLSAEETLIVIVSKSFTTAETLLNARAMREWLWSEMGRSDEVVRLHMVACSSNVPMVEKFGIDPRNTFEFWDWVGGRYSVCSAVGALPLSIQYGFPTFLRFLEGARSVDANFYDVASPLAGNLPVIMGLLGVWNLSFLGYKSRALHPYAEALLKFPAHIQQVDMESNGKHVTLRGDDVDYAVGEIDFGEPGTNGQHSFFQLLHMGQTVPCDFIGFIESQYPLCIEGEPVSNADELMANFFAQPDALAYGKTAAECRAEGRPEWLIPHLVTTGNRPSLTLLLQRLDPYATGQLLALYEHRTAVQGFIWDINSFDQWGVELGKVLAKRVRKQLNESRYFGRPISEEFNASTRDLMERYLRGQVGCVFNEPFDYQRDTDTGRSPL
jgi:glucose-6-phosphate isomerase